MRHGPLQQDGTAGSDLLRCRGRQLYPQDALYRRGSRRHPRHRPLFGVVAGFHEAPRILLVMRDSGTYRGWPQTVAVVGAGTMGLGVAECFAAAGIVVRLTDATPELTREARERLVARARGHAEAGLISAEAADLAEAVEAADDVPAAVRDADLVFEAVPEDLELKREILAACSEAAPRQSVIVSNTSSFPMDELAKPVEPRGRFLGTHWFNPPEWTPGVEVIPAAASDPEVVERVVGFLRRVG